MIKIYEITDGEKYYIQISDGEFWEQKSFKCSNIEFAKNYLNNKKDFLLQITKDDLEHVAYLDGYYEFSLSNKDKELFIIKLNNYRQNRQEIEFAKKLYGVLYKKHDDKKISFQKLKKQSVEYADKLREYIGYLATEKGGKLQELLLDFMINPDDFIEPKPKLKYTSAKEEIISILKLYVRDPKIINDYLGYFKL